LIYLAYANHVDGEINDQYRSRAGALKFLEKHHSAARLRSVCTGILVRFASPGSDELVAAVLTSEVSPASGTPRRFASSPAIKATVSRHAHANFRGSAALHEIQGIDADGHVENHAACSLYEKLAFTRSSLLPLVWPR